MVNKWKVTAIIFISLFLAETFLVGWGMYMVAKEEKLVNLCYYDVCSDYENAEYISGVCFCYEYDMLGNAQVAKTEVMN